MACVGSALIYLNALPDTVQQITPKRRTPLRFKCKAVAKTASGEGAVERRSANYRPSLWDHQYLLSLDNIYAREIEVEKRAMLLKEDVRKMLRETEGSLDQLELIDTLQRLGISYHFKPQIRYILTKIYDKRRENVTKDPKREELHATALEFRLLRQHGFNVSQDVFEVLFKDETRAFREGLKNDVEGLLSLYEASYLSIESDTKLVEIRCYATEQLRDIAARNRKPYENESYMSAMVMRALEMPHHWSIPRLQARGYIDVYGKRHNMNPVLLEFAKLDFNMLQAIHQEELKLISSWWDKTGLTKNLDFVRDRITESYFWSVGMFYEPQFKYFRQILTKVFMLVTTIDDVYDIYGTLEELEIFTDVVEKWDVNLVEELPEYMRLCFLVLYNEINQIGYDVLRDKGFNVIPYLKKAWTDLCKIFLKEAKWYKSGYKPSFREYMQNGWISSSVPTILLHLFCVSSDQISDQTLKDVSDRNPVVRGSATVLRLANDLATSSEELARGDAPKSIECYMNEKGASEAEARGEAQRMISESWDAMNSAKTARSFMCEAAANLARVVQCIYQYGDGHGFPDKANSVHRVSSVLFNPVPLN